MSYKLAYSGLFWRAPDLAQELEVLRTFGWDGWEARQPLDWLGTPQHVRRLCESSGVEVAAICGPNVALDLDGPSQHINKRRVSSFGAELAGRDLYDKGPGRGDLNAQTRSWTRWRSRTRIWARTAQTLGVVVYISSAYQSPRQ